MFPFYNLFFFSRQESIKVENKIQKKEKANKEDA